MKGTWDSIHVIEVLDKAKNAHYKLTSTVMLFIETETRETGCVTLAGSLTRQVPPLSSFKAFNLSVPFMVVEFCCIR